MSLRQSSAWIQVAIELKPVRFRPAVRFFTKGDLRMLFHVQDNDRPRYVEANDFQDAVRKWQALIVAENPGEDCSEPLPSGVALVDEEDVLRSDFADG